MKKVTDSILTQKIFEFSKALKGIWTTADLMQLISAKEKRTAMLAIARMCKNNIITRVQRGFYVTPGFDPFVLVGKLYKKSYVSLLTVLAQNAIIGTAPYQRTYVVTLKSRKPIKILGERIDFFKINKRLFFGFIQLKDGIKVAEPEKAFLDLMYFYNLGTRFTINPLVDVNLDFLKKNKIRTYLAKYKNPKFKKFVSRIIL